VNAADENPSVAIKINVWLTERNVKGIVIVFCSRCPECCIIINLVNVRICFSSSIFLLLAIIFY